MVIVPTLLDSVRGRRELVEHLEVQALGNLDPHIHFALLSDFADATAARDAGRRGRSWRPRAPGIEALNARHGEGPRPLLPLPPRAPVEPAARASGWAGSASAARSRSSTACCAAPPTRASRCRSATCAILPSVRYCLTLDTDTRLPRDAARKLIGIIAHPLNRAALRPARGPRHRGLRDPPAARQRDHGERRRLAVRARSTPGHTGVDPYTTAVSDTYQDLFGEGIFTGKGLYDVDAFTAALARARARERAALARPVRGLSTRAPRSSPTSRWWTTTRRASSPTRGASTAGCAATGRSSAGCLPLGADARRAGRATACPLISRLKILDNLRRSLVAPSLLALLRSRPGRSCPGAPAAWTAAVAGRRWRFPRLSSCCDGAARAARAAAAGASSCARPGRTCARPLAQVALQVTFLAYHAWEMLARDRAHARAAARHAAPAARVGDGGGQRGAGGRADRRQRRRRVPGARWSASPVDRRLLASLLVAVARPDALPAALPFLVLWAAAPVRRATRSASRCRERRRRARRRGARAS